MCDNCAFRKMEEDKIADRIKGKKTRQVIVDNEEVYMRKSMDGWRVVHPIKINGKINWKNLLAGGSYWNWVKIGLFLILAYGLATEYMNTLELASACLRALPDSVNLQMYIDNPNLTSTVIKPLFNLTLS